jgi:lysyl-tRNA synthetase class I
MKHLQRANHVQRKLAKINDNNLKTKWKLKNVICNNSTIAKTKKNSLNKRETIAPP